MATEKTTEKKPRRAPTAKRRVGELPALDPIAIELRRARLAKGLSHTDLNKITGISRTVLFGYEAGRTKPGAREIRLLAEALQVNPNRLLFGTDEPFKPRTGLRAIAKLRQQPAIAWVSLMVFFPIILSILDDDQIDACLTLLASLIEARDPDQYVWISTITEIMVERLAGKPPEELQRWAKALSEGNSDFRMEIEAEVAKRIAEAKASRGK